MSFKAHLDLAYRSSELFIEPSVEEFNDILYYLGRKLSSVKDFHSFPNPQQHFDVLFDVCVRDVNMQGSPGHCSLNTLGTSNRTVLGFDLDGNIDPVRYALVRETVLRRYNRVVSGVGNEMLCDPIKLFIKLEPIKTSKVLDNRYRLISSVSLIDQIVDRILFLSVAEKFKDSRLKTGCLVGYNPMKGGYIFFNSMFHPDRLNLMIDKTAFDWTVKPWMIRMAVKVLKLLNPLADDWWFNAVEQRFSSLFGNPEFIFSDGTKVIQPIQGVMKSGCYLTIVLNSILQLAIHRLSSIRSDVFDEMDFILVVGDDTIQYDFSESDAYVEAMKTTGVLPKVTRSKVPHFAGFTYYPDGFLPEYRAKHAFFLSHIDDSDVEKLEATLRSYLLLYYKDLDVVSFLRSIMEYYRLTHCNLVHEFLHTFQKGMLL